MRRLAAPGALLCLALGSCDAPPADGPLHLSDWDLFADPANQIPAPGVVPYEINAPLFSDYASKHRFIRVPEGETITIEADGRWTFPDGTVIAKTFGFYVDARDPSLGEQLVETRLLVREGGAWEPYVYRWNDAETDAVLMQGGGRLSVSFLDVAGRSRSIEYRIPNVNQCTNCHGGTADIESLGPRTDQMDHLFDYGEGLVNQIDHLASLGLFAAAPPPAGERRTMTDYADESAPLEARARAYLHANCAHCHHDGGAADQSGLWLNVEITEPVRIGICKPPAAAGRGTGGRSVAIWPGDSERSIVTFRMASEEPGIKMPELPTILSHTEGVTLITEWIDAMEPVDCLAP